MGRLLQIRVSASTYDERDVPRNWPRLCALIWPDYEPRADYSAHGVRDLAEEFVNGMRFAPWAKDMPPELHSLAAQLESENKKLDLALENWDAHTANACSVQIEDCLSQIEQALGKL